MLIDLAHVKLLIVIVASDDLLLRLVYVNKQTILIIIIFKPTRKPLHVIIINVSYFYGSAHCQCPVFSFSNQSVLDFPVNALKKTNPIFLEYTLKVDDT